MLKKLQNHVITTLFNYSYWVFQKGSVQWKKVRFQSDINNYHYGANFEISKIYQTK